MAKWIDLNDASGAKLKLAIIEVAGEPRMHLFITSMSYANPKWAAARQHLGFNEGGARRYLVRRTEPGEKLRPESFRKVFAGATGREMAADEYMLNLRAVRNPGDAQASKEERAAVVDLNGVSLLGRNDDGDRVYRGATGRFLVKVNTQGLEVRLDETEAAAPHKFLRLPAHLRGENLTPEQKVEQIRAVERCAQGLVRSMVRGEVQHSEEHASFLEAVFEVTRPLETLSPQTLEMVHSVVESAVTAYLRDTFEVAQDAYGEAARLQDLLPPYRGTGRGAATLPGPVAIAMQRLLGDTAGTRVVVPNAFDGALIAFLPLGTEVSAYRGAKDLSTLSQALDLRAEVIWGGEFVANREAGCSSMLINADPSRTPAGQRADHQLALGAVRALAPGGRAVIALALDEPAPSTGGGPGRARSAEMENFLALMYQRYEVQVALELDSVLQRKVGVTSGAGLLLLSVTNVQAPAGQGVPVEFNRVASWDDLKSQVDAGLARQNLREAQAQGIDVERAHEEGRMQRPYIPFSQLGEARCMVPANMQAPIQQYLSRVEHDFGPVDEILQHQMGWDPAAIEQRLSPEQIDAVVGIVARQAEGQAVILADETGIGKGRQIACLAARALRAGEDVVFVTDKANLFSDLARDFKNIGEWDRVRPLIVNADTDISWVPTPGAAPVVLAQSYPPAALRLAMDQDASLESLGANMIFVTYSQISTAESPKAQWIKNRLMAGHVIFDEAHLAAGDSFVAAHVMEMSQIAKTASFGSATYSKGAKNFQIYQRAFPPTVNATTLANALRRGGENFAEVFSGMLAAEGALVRREHDLSKLEVSVYTDDSRRAYHEHVSDRVAEALSSAAYLTGDLSAIFLRGNRELVRSLRDSRSARVAALDGGEIASGKLLSTSIRTGSSLYEVMKAVQGALNAEVAAARAIEHVRHGLKPVIVTEATHEALARALMREQMRENDPAGFSPNALPPVTRMPTIRDAVRSVLIKRLTEVNVVEITADDVTDVEEVVTAARHAPVQEATEAPGAAAAAAAELPAVGAVAAEPANAHAANVEPAAVEAAPAQNHGEGIGGVAAIAEDFIRELRELNAAREQEEVFEGVLRLARRRAVGADPAAQAEDGDDTDPDAVDAAAALQAAQEAAAPVPAEVAPRARTVSIFDLPNLDDATRERIREGVANIERLIESIPPIPVSAADVIRERLASAGISMGEITGRSFQLHRLPGSDGQAATPAEPLGDGKIDPLAAVDAAAAWRVVPRKKDKRTVNAVKLAFNNGELQALLINRSAATGASMHASPQFLDKSRRVLLEHAIAENPTDRIQLLGRVNRYDQVSVPLVESVSTGVYGELRWIMQQNLKLQKLSANTRSSRDNVMINKRVPDLMNVIGAEAIDSFIKDEPLTRNRLALPDAFDKLTPVDRVNVFLMRLPLLMVSEQKVVYESLFSRYDEIFDGLLLRGQNPLAVPEFDWRAKVVSDTVFFGNDAGDEPPVEHVNADEPTAANPTAQEQAPQQASLLDDLPSEVTDEDAALAEAGKESVEAAAKAMQGVSAFEQPVRIRKLHFKASRAPLTWGGIELAAKISAEGLIERNFFIRRDDGEIVWNPELADKLIKAMKGKAVLLQVAAGIETFEQAVIARPEVRDLYLRALWLEQHLPNLVPGCLVSIPQERGAAARAADRAARAGGADAPEQQPLYGVISNIELPKDPRELILPDRWFIYVVEPGMEKPAKLTLRSLLQSVEGTATMEPQRAGPPTLATTVLGEDTRENRVNIPPLQNYSRVPGGPADVPEDPRRSDFSDSGERWLTRPVERGRAGTDISKLAHNAETRKVNNAILNRMAGANSLEEKFSMFRAGEVNRQAYVLQGNMYQAYDWSVANKLGKAIVFTDQNGLRQRAVLLPSKFSSIAAHNLPLRLHGEAAIRYLAQIGQRLPNMTRCDLSRVVVNNGRNRNEALNRGYSVSGEFLVYGGGRDNWRISLQHCKRLGEEVAQKDAAYMAERARRAAPDYVAPRREPKQPPLPPSLAGTGVLVAVGVGEARRAAAALRGQHVGNQKKAVQEGRTLPDIAVAIVGARVNKRDARGMDDVASFKIAGVTPKGKKLLSISADISNPEISQYVLRLVAESIGLEIYLENRDEKTLGRQVTRELHDQVERERIRRFAEVYRTMTGREPPADHPRLRRIGEAGRDEPAGPEHEDVQVNAEEATEAAPYITEAA